MRKQKRSMGKIFKFLSEDADDEYNMINSTIVRAHQHSAGAKKKRYQCPSYRQE